MRWVRLLTMRLHAQSRARLRNLSASARTLHQNSRSRAMKSIYYFLTSDNETGSDTQNGRPYNIYEVYGSHGLLFHSRCPKSEIASRTGDFAKGNKTGKSSGCLQMAKQIAADEGSACNITRLISDPLWKLHAIHLPPSDARGLADQSSIRSQRTRPESNRSSPYLTFRSGM